MTWTFGQKNILELTIVEHKLPGLVLVSERIDGLQSGKMLVGTTDKAVHKFLQSAQQVLTTRYVATGILEEFRSLDRLLEKRAMAVHVR